MFAQRRALLLATTAGTERREGKGGSFTLGWRGKGESALSFFISGFLSLKSFSGGLKRNALFAGLLRSQEVFVLLAHVFFVAIVSES